MSSLVGCQQNPNPRNQANGMDILASVFKCSFKTISARTAVCQNTCILQSIQSLPHLFPHRKQRFTCPKKPRWKLHPEMLEKGDTEKWNWGRCLNEDKGYFHTVYLNILR